MAPRLKAARVNKSSKRTSRKPSRKQPARKAKKIPEPHFSKKAPPGNGLALYQARFTPAWPQYQERLHFMGLPGEIWNLIFSFVMPIEINAEIKYTCLRDYFDYVPLPYDQQLPSMIQPILQTCRQIRYEYGALFCNRETFHWIMPADWDSSRLTYFTQFAASVGCHDYQLTIHINDYDEMDDPDPRDWHFVRGEVHISQWGNLKQWARDLFDGVETRRLLTESNEERVEVSYGWGDFDDHHNAMIIEWVLDGARDARGTAWSRFLKRFEEVWQTYWEIGYDRQMPL